MNEGVRVYLQLECESNELKKSIGEYIHNQLKGYRDYKNSNIVLNIDEPYTVRLWVFKECKDIPKITLPDLHWTGRVRFVRSAREALIRRCNQSWL